MSPSYLSRLTGHPAFSRLAPLLPPAICPFLFYNLAPYLFTLANDGWFDWVNKHPLPQKRATIGPNDFTKKSINRKYVNEVLVCCPNPGKKVVAGVGPWDKGRAAIRILKGDEICPNGHQAGQMLLLDSDTGQAKAERFFRLFPQILLESLGDTTMAEAICSYDRRDNGQIRVAEIISPCRFHKRANGPAALPLTHLLPDNFCPHVFAAIYPRVLALMYGANIDPVVTIDHPGGGGEVCLKLQKKTRTAGVLAGRTLNVIGKGLQWLGRPLDRLDYDINILVQKNEAADCTLRPSNSYAVNISDPDFCCPAAFATLYPFLLLAAAGNPLPWPDTARISCPDCAGIIYQIPSA